MAYCSKCGIELEKGWVHCPACGQAVVKSATTRQPRKNVPPAHPIPSETLPTLNDRESNISAKKEEVRESTFSLKTESRNFLKFLGVFFTGAVVISLFFTGSSESSESINDVNGPTETSFQQISRDFRAAGCKPERYTSENGFKYMTVDFSEEPLDFDTTVEFQKRAIDVQEWNSFGNQVDRALFIIQDYQGYLSNIYFYLYNFYRDFGMAKYEEQFKKYLDTLSRDAAKLCYTSSPSKMQYQLAEKYTTLEVVNNLDVDWQMDFRTWLDDVWAAQEKAAVLYDKNYAKKQEEDNETTVYCEEKNTSLEDYKLIKCYP